MTKLVYNIDEMLAGRVIANKEQIKSKNKFADVEFSKEDELGM